MSESEKSSCPVKDFVEESEAISQLYDSSTKLGNCVVLIQEQAKQLQDTDRKIEKLIEDKRQMLARSADLHATFMAQVSAQLALHNSLQQPSGNQIVSPPIIAVGEPYQPPHNLGNPLLLPSQAQPQPSSGGAMAVIPFQNRPSADTMIFKATQTQTKSRACHSRSASRSRSSSRSSSLASSLSGCEPKKEKREKSDTPKGSSDEDDDDDVQFIDQIIKFSNKRYEVAEKKAVLHTMVHLLKTWGEQSVGLIINNTHFWEKFKELYQKRVGGDKSRSADSLKSFWKRMATQILNEGDNFFASFNNSDESFSVEDKKILKSFISKTTTAKKEDFSAKRIKLG